MTNNLPMFEQLVTPTLDRCKNIFQERGAQYGDTWAVIQPLAMQAVARKLQCAIPENAWRALLLAALLDVKYWRNTGGYREDNLDDGINYAAALATEMQNVTNNHDDFPF